jgi:nucleotide-binding universal stress UspA family protein
MSSSKNVIVVPMDFTPVTDCAFKHALNVADHLDSEQIVLLHIVAKEKDRADAEKRMTEYLAKNKVDIKTRNVTSVIKEGNIFDDIGGVAEELNAKLIVMGTHGVKGMQHILGSYAVKVITHSKVPFIVVRERDVRNGYKNIVMPFDLSKEGKQKLNMTIQIAKAFNSKVHVFFQHETDELLKKTINNNVQLAKAELRSNGIEFDVQEAESGNFVKQILAYSTKIDADLIAIVNTQEAGVPEIFGGTDERTLITNEARIPVMILNPLRGAYGASVIFS